MSRILHRTRVALDERRTRAMPWRRSFGQPGLASPDVIAQRKLEWRASIYNQRLQAVPSTLSCQEQIKSRNSTGKEKMLQKIEPWIRRELQAVLGDPDPTVIVHVATSQFFAWLAEKAKVPSGVFDVEERFISPLRPFLLDKVPSLQRMFLVCILTVVIKFDVCPCWLQHWIRDVDIHACLPAF
ncbi:E3 ubiquitin-protein ligase Topors isoform X2 [Senna tora]|uniref:RING-type E3 ubiquitin transferase n=1 Tax=Senna tora TaxID=362788 RepID=A0A835CEP2_9FABA|nr:E3 ubiquitin-protein ligase Topors isoform X2 [Senna tora]